MNSHRDHVDRGFSLIELLLAITLLIAIAAIALPVISSRVATTSEQAAVDTLREVVQVARLRAQLRSEALEVCYHGAEPASLVIRVFDPLQPIEEDDTGADDARMIEEPWASRPMPRNTRMTTQPPAVGEDVYVDGSWIEEEGFIRLAIVLPDGTALPGPESWLSFGDDQFTASLDVDPWTADVIVTPVEADDDELSDQNTTGGLLDQREETS